MHDLKKTFGHFLCFQFLFRKILFLMSKIFAKTSPPKICDSLYFFSLLFLLNLFSFFVSSLCVYSPCLYSSYSLFLHVFFFLFPCFLSLRLLSLCLFTLSYVSSVCVLPFFCETFFESPLFFVFFGENTFLRLFIPFCRTFLSNLIFCFVLFSYCFFFQSCFFQKDKLTFFALRKLLVEPSKNLISEFLLFDISSRGKVLSSFFLFWTHFSKKKLIFWTSWKLTFPCVKWKKVFPQKLLLQKKQFCLDLVLS